MKFIRKKVYIFFIVVIYPLAAFFLFFFMYERERAIAFEKFLFGVDLGAKIIEDKLTSYPDILFLLRSRFIETNLINISKWELDLASLDLLERYKGIVGVSYVIVTNNSEWESTRTFLATQYKPYNITNSEFNIIDVDPLQEYSAVLGYIYPINIHSQRFGFNVLAEEKRRKEIIHSIESGYPAATSLVSLVGSDNKLLNSVVVYLPVYKYSNGSTDNTLENTRGLVSMAINLDDFFTDVFTEFGTESYTVKVFDVEDDKNKSNENIIYKRGDDFTGIHFLADYEFRFGGRDWIIEFSSDGYYRFDYEKTFFIFLAIVNIFLIWVFLVVRRVRQIKLLAQKS